MAGTSHHVPPADGKGKGDAVRAGFDVARAEILMMLDAGLTVPPDDLVKFYRARVSGVCEFVNGSRLVPAGSPFKDTLCGTKVIDGTTNIQRWRHGWLLWRMTLFAARRVSSSDGLPPDRRGFRL